MKRILSLVLCLVFALTAFASCTEQQHTHTYAGDWSADAENHWHTASCEHTSEKSDIAAHTGTEDGVCDVCKYVTAYTVTVEAPENVTVEGDLSGAPGSDITFTASVDDIYHLSVDGAETVGDPTSNDGKLTYTLKVASIGAPTTVKIAAIKTVYGEEIATGDGVIAAEKAWVSAYSTVTVNVPAPGKYAIYPADESGVEFGENTEDNLWDFDQCYIFEATEAGDVTIKVKVWPQSTPEDGEVPYEYAVVSCEDVVLVGNKGTYTLPANVELNVTYTAPTEGLYELVSSVENLVIDYEIRSTVAFAASEDGAEITFKIKLDDYTVTTFEFDFDITSFNNNAANEGENTVVLTYVKYYPVEFTAPKAGSYTIVANSEAVLFYQWNTEYNYMAGIWDDFVSDNLEVGEKFIFYVRASDFEATEETLEAVITIEHAGYLVSEEDGVYKSQASADGALNIFNQALEGETYFITAPEGFQISLDGENWSGEIEHLAVGNIIEYFVKGDGIADITIEEFEYKIEIAVGTTTVTLEPGISYNVYISGFTSQAMYKTVVISWNNASVSGYSGWYMIESGDTVNYVTESSAAATLTLDAEASAEVTFTVEDITSDDAGNDDDNTDTPGGSESANKLALGENSIHVTVDNYYCAGIDVSFTATEAGTYTLSAAAGETNASVIYLESAYMSETVELPYEFTLGAGETINFIIATSAFMTLTEDDIDLVLSKN